MKVICVFVGPGVYLLAAGEYCRVPSAVDARENPEMVGTARSLRLGVGISTEEA